MRNRFLALTFAVALTASGCTLDRGNPVVPRRAADPGATAGGRLRVALTEPDGVDPTNAHEPSNMLITSVMCDTLITLDPVDGRPKPGLAESWSISGGGRKLIVKLRKDARFSDGERVTADDVVFTMTRLADQRFASRSARVIDAISGFSFIHGDETTEDERFRDNLVGIRAIENRAVEITLDERLADFAMALTHPATSIVPRAAVERDPGGFSTHPVCAGPYRLKEPWKPGAVATLVRSDTYSGSNPAFTRGGRGYVDTIEFIPFADRNSAYQAVALGNADIAEVPEAALAAVRQEGVALSERETPRLEYIGLPVSVAPFDDRRVRLALSQAVDRKGLAATIYGDGRAPARGILPTSMRDGRDPCEAASPASGDIAAARATLAEAGVDLSGKTARIYVSDEFSNAAVAAAVAARWDETFGLKAEVVPVSWETFLASAISPKGFDGGFRSGWYPRYPSIDQVLVPLFHEESIGRDNFTRFSSRDFNEAIASARRAVDDNERTRDYLRAAALVCEQMPVIPLLFESRAYRLDTSRFGSAVQAVLSSYSAEPVLRELFAK